MRMRGTIVALAAALSIAASAGAGSIQIDGLNSNPFSISSKTMAKLIPANGEFSDTKLAKLHKKLKGDGIKTNGRVTFILAETNNGGLSLVTLVDKQKKNASASGDMSSLFMDAEASSGLDLVQGTGADFGAPEGAGGMQDVSGDFMWNPNGTGDAFAWTNLDHGDHGSFQFAVNSDDPSTFAGLKETGTFQFVAWTDDGWQVVQVGEFSDGVFSFSFSVAPVPPAVAMGLAGLLGVAAVRRRFCRES